MKLFRSLVLLLVPLAMAFGADGPRDVTPQSVLADQVKAIASSRTSTKEKQKSISSAVKFAVLAATADLKDAAQVVKVALEFTTAAANAAPEFVDAIVSGVAAIPGIADIDGALPQIQTVVTETAKNALDSGGATTPSSTSKTTANPDFGGSTGDVIVSPTL
jgi:hypothetical protein